MKYKNREIKWCIDCDTAIIGCEICKNSSCNGCGCDYCNDDFKLFTAASHVYQNAKEQLIKEGKGIEDPLDKIFETSIN